MCYAQCVLPMTYRQHFTLAVASSLLFLTIPPLRYSLDGIWPVRKKDVPLKREEYENFYLVRFLLLLESTSFLLVTMDKYRPRTDLVSCTACGHLNPMGFLCVNCYDKVREETNRLRALISNQLPSDHEIRFVYEDDPSQTVSSNDEIIKVPHSRPSWFPIHFLRRFRPAS
ncbi:unnamed protein product [Dicrocoelium dendriticum]|nr:unnamed protein product [Dicrocoelium dendriticum]